MAKVRHDRIDLGGALAPDEAFLLHRGLATLPLRVDRANRTALQVATALRGPPARRARRPPRPARRTATTPWPASSSTPGGTARS